MHAGDGITKPRALYKTMQDEPTALPTGYIEYRLLSPCYHELQYLYIHAQISTHHPMPNVVIGFVRNTYTLTTSDFTVNMLSLKLSGAIHLTGSRVLVPRR